MFELQALSDVYVLVCFRVGNIRMGVSVQQDLGLGRSVLVEQCTCPTGYGGTSCEVRSINKMKYTSTDSTHKLSFSRTFLQVGPFKDQPFGYCN